MFLLETSKLSAETPRILLKTAGFSFATPQIFTGDPRNTGVSNENLKGLQRKSGSLQRKFGVSDENLGVSNENIGVSNENLGVSNENMGPLLKIWGLQ